MGRFQDRLLTWHIEVMVILAVLTAVAVVAGASFVQWNGMVAVMLTTRQMSIADRLREAAEHGELARCHDQQFVTTMLTQASWVSYFLQLGGWLGIAGCAITTSYPIWRLSYRRWIKPYQRRGYNVTMQVHGDDLDNLWQMIKNEKSVSFSIGGSVRHEDGVSAIPREIAIVSDEQAAVRGREGIRKGEAAVLSCLTVAHAITNGEEISSDMIRGCMPDSMGEIMGGNPIDVVVFTPDDSRLCINYEKMTASVVPGTPDVRRRDGHRVDRSPSRVAVWSAHGPPLGGCPTGGRRRLAETDPTWSSRVYSFIRLAIREQINVLTDMPYLTA